MLKDSLRDWKCSRIIEYNGDADIIKVRNNVYEMF